MISRDPVKTHGFKRCTDFSDALVRDVIALGTALA